MNPEDKTSSASHEGEITYYSLEIITGMTRLGPTVIERCIQMGLVQPTRPATEAERYSSLDVARLRKVRRLIQELGLNWAGVEIVVRLTDELEVLKAELERLRR